jgi:hypothetical protein
MSTAIDAALDELATSTALEELDRRDVTTVVGSVEEFIERSGFALSDERRLTLAAHTLAFTRRIRTHENLPDIDLEDFPEIPETTIVGMRRILTPYCEAHDSVLSDQETFLFAMHVEVARVAS